MVSDRPRPIHQYPYQPATGIVYSECHRSRTGDCVGNRCRGIERIGHILGKGCRQARVSSGRPRDLVGIEKRKRALVAVDIEYGDLIQIFAVPRPLAIEKRRFGRYGDPVRRPAPAAVQATGYRPNTRCQPGSQNRRGSRPCVRKP